MRWAEISSATSIVPQPTSSTSIVVGSRTTARRRPSVSDEAAGEILEVARARHHHATWLQRRRWQDERHHATSSTTTSSIASSPAAVRRRACYDGRRPAMKRAAIPAPLLGRGPQRDGGDAGRDVEADAALDTDRLQRDHCLLEPADQHVGANAQAPPRPRPSRRRESPAPARLCPTEPGANTSHTMWPSLVKPISRRRTC